MKKTYRNQVKRVDEDKDIEQVEDVQVDDTIDSTDEVVEDVPVDEADEAEPEQIDDVQVDETIPDDVDEQVDEDVEEREAEEEPEQEQERETEEEPAQVTEPDEHIIEGYAIVFNELSEDLGGFREIIEPDAIDNELINNSDIYYLFNHNSESIPLARSKNGEGSLKLSIDNKGLKYSFNCLNSEFYGIVQRGDLDKSSFAFSLSSDGSGEKWEKSNEYNYIRRITKIERLYDCSAVLVPAYSSTSVYARSNDNKKEVDETYYNQYENIIDSLLR